MFGSTSFMLIYDLGGEVTILYVLEDNPAPYPPPGYSFRWKPLVERGVAVMLTWRGTEVTVHGETLREAGDAAAELFWLQRVWERDGRS